MTHRMPARFLSFALALLMTTGMLHGVDHLAVVEAAHAADLPAGSLMAQGNGACAAAPRA